MFVQSCNEQLADVESALLDIERLPPSMRGPSLDAAMRAAHTIKGDAASFGATALSSFCHALESVLSSLKNGELPIDGELTGALLRAFDLVRLAAAAAGQGHDGQLAAESARLKRAVDQAAQALTLARTDANRPDDADGPDDEADLRTAEAAKMDERIASITLPSSELDDLLDLVGELGIVQTRLTGLVRRTGNREFDAVAEEIERISALLRDRTLGMRMLPLSTGYAKYRRLVRDACAALGKKAELVMSGGAAQLDKTVIERLNAPFIHLLRNAVDHGLEPPAVRKSLGKPETGRIEIAARQEGSEVVIEVRDDGAGVDTGRLRRKAEAMGLVSPQDQLGERDLLELIFHPGLSTAQALGEVSGRGVGMDAVREGVRALRGRVEAASVPGRGAAFVIRLPASLAIIDCLLVGVAGERYYFHLDYVEECLEADFGGRGAEGGRAPGMISFRGRALPLLCLREFFRLDGQPPDRVNVVVVRTGEGRFGVAADEVLGRGQAVLKGLGPALGNVPGVLGGTVTEDGDMALVLDIPALARTALAEMDGRERPGGERAGAKP